MWFYFKRDFFKVQFVEHHQGLLIRGLQPLVRHGKGKGLGQGGNRLLDVAEAVVIRVENLHRALEIEAILAAFAAVPGLRQTTRLYEANHTFMRDDGERWDPQCSDHAWGDVIAFLQKELG